MVNLKKTYGTLCLTVPEIFRLKVFKEISPQFLIVVHIAAKGAEPLEELHKVNVSTAILVENICEIL